MKDKTKVKIIAGEYEGRTGYIDGYTSTRNVHYGGDLYAVVIINKSFLEIHVGLLSIIK